MNKIVFSLCLLTFTTTAFSQINKGQWLIGGSGSLNFSKFGDDDNSKTTTVTISPDAGYFFINNLAGGVRASFQSEKEKSAEDATTVFLFAPFLRYYFMPGTQKVNIFADASYGFGSAKSGDSESFNSFSFAAGPAVFLSPNTALEFTVQYSSLGGDLYGGDDRMNNIGVNVGFQVHLGK